MSRELDAEVAEKVMDGAAAFRFVCPRCRGTMFSSITGDTGQIVKRVCSDMFDRACRWSGPSRECVPEYSSDWAAMGEVMEKMRADGWNVTIRAFRSGRYEVDMTNPHHEPVTEVEGKTLPEAVALAALKAVGARK